MDINMRDVGKRIKERRKQMGLTQMDIQKSCGIQTGALSHIEQGLRTPSITLFYKLATVLQIDMTELLTGNTYEYEKKEMFIEEYNYLPADEQEEIRMLIRYKKNKKNIN